VADSCEHNNELSYELTDRVHNSPPPIPILRQTNPIRPLPWDIELSPTPRSPMWSFPLRFLIKILHEVHISAFHATCATHIILREVYEPLTSLLRYFISFGTYIALRTLFANFLNLR